MSVWVGIGGFGNPNLWQGGVEIDVRNSCTKEGLNYRGNTNIK